MNLQNKLMKIEQSEGDLRDQLESALARVRVVEQKSRSKDEELFSMTRDNQTLMRDIKNMRDIEAQLKSEIQTINNQRAQ